jgi:Cell division protein CrgA
MARKTPTKRRGGRVTPRAQESSGRYTPPIPREEKVSPPWVPALMFTCLLLGVAIVILNYLPHVLPGGTSNWYLLLGLGLITAGFVTATQYH